MLKSAVVEESLCATIKVLKSGVMAKIHIILPFKMFTSHAQSHSCEVNICTCLSVQVARTRIYLDNV